MSDLTDQLPTLRQLELKIVAQLDDEQLTVIPEMFNNNILWNLGHLAVTQQLLTYDQAGLPIKIPEAWPSLFRKGTSPRSWTRTPDIEHVKAALTELPETFANDYKAGLFSTYERYQTHSGPLLETIEDAIRFNDFHEGLHLGVILSLRKLV